ncbi:DNA methyltransferase [Legionella fairfieldensis]|uniref:DNA methyltransferase n=1 Tax=Legionella fairfieldensis TaxID=45064 RepID=UPI003D15D9FF
MNNYNHHCPGNLAHVEWLIEKFTEPKDVILDPFRGSGTKSCYPMPLKQINNENLLCK